MGTSGRDWFNEPPASWSTEPLGCAPVLDVPRVPGGRASGVCRTSPNAAPDFSIASVVLAAASGVAGSPEGREQVGPTLALRRGAEREAGEQGSDDGVSEDRCHGRGREMVHHRGVALLATSWSKCVADLRPDTRTGTLESHVRRTGRLCTEP